MSLITLCSASGAPGVTTTALALTWVWPAVHADRRVLLIDADPAGSGVIPGFLRAGIPSGEGVLALAADRAHPTSELVIEHSLALDADGQRMVLVGLSDPAQARPLQPTWTELVEVARDLSGVGIDVLADVGRLGHRFEPTPLVRDADVVALVLRSSLPSVAVAAAALRSLRQSRGAGLAPTVLLVGEGRPYSASDVAKALGVPRASVMAHDPWAADALAGGGAAGWRFDRSPLLRSARSLAQSLAATSPALTSVELS